MRYNAVLVLLIIVIFPWDEALGQFDRRQRNAPELIVEANGRMGACDALLFSPDGKELYATGDDKVVQVWHFANQGLEPKTALRWKTWRERRGSIYALALAPEGSGVGRGCVAVAGLGVRNGSVAVIDQTSGAVKFGLTEVEQDALQLMDQVVWSLAFSPSGSELAIGSNDGSVWLWNLASAKKNDVKKLGRHAKDGAANPVRLVSFLSEGKVLSVADDRSVVEWNTAQPGTSTERFRFQRVPNVRMVAISADRQWLAAAGEGRLPSDESRVVEIRSLDGQQTKSITWSERGRYPNRLAFDTAGKRLAVGMFLIPPDATFAKEADGEVAIYDLTPAQPVATLRFTTAMTPEGIAFHPDGQHLALATSHDYELTLWNIQGAQPKRVDLKRSLGSCLWAVGVSSDGRYLGFQDDAAANPPHPNERGAGSWRVFDLQKREWVREVFDKAKQSWALALPFDPVPQAKEEGGWSVEFDPQDAYIWYAVGPDKQKHRIPLNPSTDDRPRCFTFLKAENNQPVRLAVGHYWGASLFELSNQGVRRVRIFTGHQGEVMGIAASADQQMLFTVSRDQTVAAWSLTDWQYHPELGAKFGDKDGKVVVEAVDPGSPAWEAGLTANDEVVFFRVGGFEKPDFDYDRRETAKTVGTVPQCLEQLGKPVPGKSFYFEIARPGQKELAKLLTTVRQRPLWRFFPTRDREWVLWRWQDYFYDTSTNGDFLIGWQVCGDVDQTPVFHCAEQFRGRYHRPDIVARTLQAKRWIRPDPRIDRVVLREEEPPDVTLVATAREIKDQPVQLKITVTPRGPLPEQQAERVILWLNDFRYREWRKPGAGVFETELSIPANQFRSIPENRIIVQCYNQAGNRSPKAEVVLESSRRPTAPRLFGLAIGVGDNSHTRLPGRQRKFEDVRECVADAKRIQSTWETKATKAYQIAEFARLCDDAVTPDNVLQQIRQLAPKARPDDLFVLFLAGHGFADGILQGPQFAKPGSFIFVCSRFDYEHPNETGLTSQALYEAMAELPCRKLVLVNACHSGAIVADGNESAYSDPVRDLTRDGIGPIVIAACGPKQQAYVVAVPGEDEGGLFTQAVTRGLGPEFDAADSDKNGILDTRELATFIQRRVQELAREYQAQQSPTATPLEKERFTLSRK